MNTITCIAPVNIAVIKYWGKRNEKLILPLNDSISVTLSTNEMHAKTTIACSPKFDKNRIWLNGVEESFDNPRLQACLREIRKSSMQENGEDKDISDWKVHVCSSNNFPTAAGLASSAAGYACLVYTLAQLYGVKGDLSAIARQGSGSACRSVFGGFVQWLKGEKDSGEDSIAVQLAPHTHWPQLRILILVVSDNKKSTSSTSGMQRSVETSELLKHRVTNCVPKRVEQMIKAIDSKDFKTFAEISMKDSNQFHSVCLDTYPPAVYMNDVSRAIVEFVHSYNKAKGETKLAYTFDAGPNACLFCIDNDLPEIVSQIQHTFPPDPDCKQFIIGNSLINPVSVKQDLLTGPGPFEPGLLKYIIMTKVGEGPKVLSDPTEHLLDNFGVPKFLKNFENHI